MKPVAPPNAEFPGRAVTIVCGVLACCLMAKAQNADSELAQARDEFIAKLFTKCNDDTYYFGPHEVIHLACGATGRDVTDCAELIEYKGFGFPKAVKVPVDPPGIYKTVLLDPPGTYELPLLKTDMLADVEKRVLVIIDYTSYRSRMIVTYSTFFNSPAPPPGHRSWAPEWDQWEKPVINAVPAQVYDRQSQGLLTAGPKAFGYMIKKDGQWTFAPGPDFPLDASLSQVFGRVGLNGGPVADSLAELFRGPGPPAVVSPIPELMAKAGLIQKIESEKPRSCGVLFPEEWPRPVPSLVRPDTVLPPSAKAMLNPPKFTGTADQFAAAFPGFLRQAAAAAGLNAEAFGKESDYVINSIRTCAQITPTMAAQTTRKDLPVGARLVNTRALGAQYAVCQSGGGTAANGQYPDTQIAVQVIAGAGENWLQGKGFAAFVFFLRPKGGNYPIIYATIPGPGLAPSTR